MMLIKILLIEDNPGDTRLITEVLNEGSGFAPNTGLLYKLEFARCIMFGSDRERQDNSTIYVIRNIIRRSIEGDKDYTPITVLKFIDNLLSKGLSDNHESRC